MVHKFNLNNIFSDNFVRLTGEGQLDEVMKKIGEETIELDVAYDESCGEITEEIVLETLDVAQAAITAVMFLKQYDPEFCNRLAHWLTKQEERKEEYGVKDDI